MTAPVSVLGIGQVLPTADAPFDAAASSTGRGYRRLPTAAKYALAAARTATEDAGPAFAKTADTRRGIVLGTNNATAALHDALDGAILAGDAMDMSPTAAPFFACSVFAARVSMEYALRGFALTVNNPRTAGLQAFSVTSRALRRGRAEVVLTGAAEDDVTVAGGTSAGVGSVVFVCGQASEAGLGHVSTRSAFLTDSSTDHLDALWNDLTGQADPAITAFLDTSPVGESVAKWLSRHGFEFDWTEQPPGCLSPVAAVADVLTHGGARPRAVISAGADGGVTFALVSRARPAEEQGRTTPC